MPHAHRGVLATALCVAGLSWPVFGTPIGQGAVHPDVWRYLAETAADEPVKVWVLFSDKAVAGPVRQAAFESLAATYAPRALQRRHLRRSAPGLFDERDLPVAGEYIQQVRACGVQPIVISRWLNAVSAAATPAQIKALAALPCVREVRLVARSTFQPPVAGPIVQTGNDAGTSPVPAGGATLNYGPSATQLNQINVPALHQLGYSGAGMILAVLDTGFYKAHENIAPSRIVAEWDFVRNDGNTQNESGDPAGQHNHGTTVLSIAAGRKDGKLYGPAYEAGLILCKTEDISQEVPAEEDFFIAGLEFAEAHGADVVTSSLGYIDWYSQSQLNGQTAVTTVGVNTAIENGLVCVTAAGNMGGPGPRLIAPADAFRVITVGAVDGNNNLAGFSSRGPTADGRVKPEVVAMGVGTWGASAAGPTSYSSGSGTSYATPLVAGVAILLLQAHPTWTVDQLRAALFQTADVFVATGTFDPGYGRGYGKVDALGALRMPAVLSVLSRRVHGPAGVLDLDVTVRGAVEPRSGGPRELWITLDQPVQILGAPTSAVHSSSGTVLAVQAVDRQVRVTLAGVADAAPLVVGFPGIAHAQQSSARVTDTLCLRVLAGDVGGDAAVSVLDLVGVRNLMGRPLESANPAGDVNVDGYVDVFDLMAVRNRFGGSCPPCP